MPRAQGSKDYISLVQGLATEVNPLAAPEGSTSDEQNFLLDTNGGVRKRRRGFQNVRDDSDQVISGSTESKVIETYYWIQEDLFVVVTGFNTPITYVRFHNNDSTLSFAGEFPIAGSFLQDVQVDEVRGNLILTGSSSALTMNPLLIAKDGSTLNFYRIKLYIRDFELVDDGLRVSERPSTLSTEHNYNILNSGWYAQRKLEGGTTGDPIAAFFTEGSDYPSNADIPVLGLKSDEDGFEVFSPETLRNTVVGSTEAPRGHYVYSIDNFSRTSRETSPSIDGTVSSTITLEGSISI